MLCWFPAPADPMFYGDPNRGLVSASYGIVQVCQTLVLLLLRRLRGCSVREGDLGRNSAGNVGRGWMRWKRMPHLRYGPLPASKHCPCTGLHGGRPLGGPSFPYVCERDLVCPDLNLIHPLEAHLCPPDGRFVFFSLGVGSGWAPVSRRCHKQTNITNKLEAVANFRSSHLRVCCTAADQILRVFHQSCWPRGS